MIFKFVNEANKVKSKQSCLLVNDLMEVLEIDENTEMKTVEINAKSPTSKYSNMPY